MIEYIKKSICKFKSDALSKVIYDILKYLWLTFVIALILKFIPWIGEVISTEFSISFWLFFVILVLLIIISFMIFSYLFNRKYRLLQLKSQIDELTGLKNHKALENDFSNIIDNMSSEDLPLSFILIDIDDFKKFNELHSYEIADKVLAKLGNLLSRDSRITDETYRYFMRGDEFLIIAKRTTLANAKSAADRKRTLIKESTLSSDNKEFNVTVCCGVTEFNSGDSKEAVLNRVESALKKAKKSPNKNKTEIVI